MEVKELGYLAFEVSDLAVWETFATKVLGVGVTNRRSNGGYSLCWDKHKQRVFVEQGPRDDVVAVGLEVADEAAMQSLSGRVAKAGYPVTDCTAAEAAARDVKKLVHFVEPGGMRIEIYYGPAMADKPFKSEVVASGFNADSLGLGHCVLRAKNLKQSVDFFCDVVGFRLSDYIITDIGGYKVNIGFTHLNGRHHSVAFGEGLPKSIHHFLLEVNSFDDVGLAFDRAVDGNVIIEQTIGRHPNDKMVSFYAQTPSGFQFEYGWGGIIVDDAKWQPTTYHAISEWGHRHPSTIWKRPKKPA